MSTYTNATSPKAVNWDALAEHGWLVDNNDNFVLAVYPNSLGSVCLALQAVDDPDMRVFGLDWPQVQHLARTLAGAIQVAEQIQQQNREQAAAETTLQLIQRIKDGVRNGNGYQQTL